MQVSQIFCKVRVLSFFFVTQYRVTILEEKQMSVINKQVKHVIQNAPYYLWDNLVINSTTHQWETWTLKSQLFEILRVEVIVEREIYYLDLIVDADSYKFLGMGQCSDKQVDFTISTNICKSLAISKYMEEAN